MNFARLFLAALVLSCFAGTALAQTMARVLVGYPPGSSMDSAARLVAEKLGEALGRTFVVENRTGAAGQFALTAVKTSVPDGNTLSLAPDSILSLAPHTSKTLPYDTLNDFVPVAYVGGFEYALAVNAGVPAKDLREWINWVKADKKNAVYGSLGAGAASHFLGFMLAQAIGVELVHVPYRGSALATDLLGGQVPAGMMGLYQVVPLTKAGKTRILAHSGGGRSPLAPEIPTFKELGYPTLDVSGWFGLVARADTPAELVRRYNEIVVQAMRTPAVRERMRSLDLYIREMTPAEMAVMLKSDYERWRPIVKASGFSSDQ